MDLPRETIWLGGGEFGETYHVAAASIICERQFDFQIAVVEGKLAEAQVAYLRGISGRRIEPISRGEFETSKGAAGFHKPSHSTNLIVKSLGELKGNELAARLQAVHNRLLGTLQGSDYEVVRELISRKLASAPREARVSVWVRNRCDNKPERNSTPTSVARICEALRQRQLSPVLIGAPMDGVERAAQAPSLLGFYNDQAFADPENQITRQLLVSEILRAEYGVIAQIGRMSGAMDGPMLRSQPTVEFAHEDDLGRMRKLARIIPTFRLAITADRREISPSEMDQAMKDLHEAVSHAC